MDERERAIQAAIRRPLPLPYHPLYRFYEGGSLTRQFRGLPDRPDDWWSEDWVGSVTRAGNEDPEGRPQGLSEVDIPGVGAVSLATLIEAFPEAMLGDAFATRWGPITGVLVKLLSPAGQVPLHAHPSREWAERHLGSRFGKTEAWILLDTPGDGQEPAYAGIGFHEGVTRAWFRDAVDRRDLAAIRASLHRTPIAAGEVYVAHAGVPHFLGPRISFIEVQEPSDHIVIPETSGDDDEGATMGLGWDLALDMIDYETADAESTFARARQRPTIVRQRGVDREARLFDGAVMPFFDATRLDVADRIEVDDRRFAIGIVVGGQGWLSGEFGRYPVQRGDSFAAAATLPFEVVADRAPLAIVRCMGPLT
jgi:mannose-6-phosphate isomerase